MPGSQVAALAAYKNDGIIKKFTVERRAVGDSDVKLDILYCGICHTDLHQIMEEWGRAAAFPMVPGHEIVGIVTEVGKKVRHFKKGDKAGVGYYIDSCRDCASCRTGEQPYCTGAEGGLPGMLTTYNAKTPDGKITYGGFSQAIVVDESYTLRIPDSLDLPGAAPLLCAGITVWSPMMQFGIKPTDTVGIVGLGGLGHMALQFAHAFGCETTVISTSAKKEKLAQQLGANHFVVFSDEKARKSLNSKLDFIVDSVSNPHKLEHYLAFLRKGGRYTLVGIPTEPYVLPPAAIIAKRASIGGSMVGSIQATQEMLDFCGLHNISCMVEVIDGTYVNRAMQRLAKNDVNFRFVIDTKTITPTSHEPHV